MTSPNREILGIAVKDILRTVIIALTFLCSFLFLLASFTLIAGFVHTFNHSPRQLSLLSEAMHDTSPLPAILAGCIVLYFIVDHLLIMTRPVDSSRNDWFGRSGLFLAGCVVVLVLLSAFWLTDGPHIKWYPGFINPYVLTSSIFSLALLLGLIVGVSVRFMSERFRILCYLPPVVCIAGLWWLARQMEAELGSTADYAPMSVWPTSFRLTIVLGMVILINALLFWAEKRFRQSCQGTSGLFCAALWVVAAVMAIGIPAPFACMCTVWGPKHIENAAIVMVLFSFLAAIITRLILYRHRNRSQRKTTEK
ncbi:MAG: hypothetical protein SVV80_02800 [Planctomycetota bacterium]|nr:hypothetical protein [Planctomycetota bacterium]